MALGSIRQLAAMALGAAALLVTLPAAAEPALWRLKNGESTLYFLGSFHALPDDITWRGPNIDKAVKSADIVVFEASGAMQSFEKAERYVRDNGILPRGKTLSKMLSKEGLEDYKKVLAKSGAEPELVNVSHPWRAWFMLETEGIRIESGESCECDISMFNGVDLKLMQEADKKKMPKRYFETAQQQMAAFEAGLPDENVKDFERHLKDLLTKKINVKSMMREWARGNVAAIAKENAKDRKEYPLEFESVLLKRNANWIPQIEKMLTENKTIFITVGAAHLAGEDSVIDMLCKKNLKVERVNGPGGSACGGGAAPAKKGPNVAMRS